MKDLPKFQKRNREAVLDYISAVLTKKQRSEKSYLIALIAYDDGHYRTIFDPAYFVIHEGQDRPSKSQWNGLKKKLKHHDRRVFVFKEHGEVECDGKRCYYVDFGFFAA